MSDQGDRIGLGEEAVPAGEEAMIRTIAELNRAVLNTKERPVHRGQHPKGHGGVEAEFIVEPGLPELLRHGLFATPKTLRGIIRFSNGAKWDDTKGDAHGMAVKLRDVDGATIMPDAGGRANQDFIMVDHPVFFIRNVADYVAFSRAFADGAKSPWRQRLAFLPKVPDLIVLASLYFRFFKDHKHEFDILKSFTSKTPLSPLQVQYWSTTPYKLGPHAIRFSARPVLDGVPPAPPSSSPNLLREAMSAQLKTREATFDFLVQVQTDPVAMPVEDPTLPWDEAAAPWVKVATIRIPPQSFESPEQMTACENLSFSPWHALPEHRPLGGINRTRKAVYELISKTRHELNGVPTDSRAAREAMPS